MELAERGWVQHRFHTLIVTVAAAAMLATAPSAAHAANAQHPDTTSSAYESRLLRLVNSERARRGRRPLRLWSCADGYAKRWSVHLAHSSFLRHPSLATVKRSCRARWVGENIGYGNISADAMMRAWMASSGHRANILDARFTYIGLGAVRSGGHWYAVQEFIGL